jgi:dTDP-4-dehydrorhamnose reductase
MKYILTGMNGTVAPALAQQLVQTGHQVIAWDRSQLAIDDPAAIRAFLNEHSPDGFFHIATGSPAWAELIAQLCAERQLKLIFTSTVSVFGPQQQAPLTPDTPPAAEDDYGRYKRECEQRMLNANPALIIARLAWQIGDAPGSNTMVNYIDQQVRERGELAASTAWYPACAFLADTAAGLAELMREPAAGIYHLDGNAGLSFYAIAQGLNETQGHNWPIVPSETPVFDNRMHDPRLRIGLVSARLKAVL